MKEDTMPKAIGVYRRKDSAHYHWRIKVPKDLKPTYGGSQWAHGCSLGTSNLREANHRATLLRAEWLTRLEQQRQQLGLQNAFTPDRVQSAFPAKHFDLDPKAPVPPSRQLETRKQLHLRDVFGRWKSGKDDNSDSVKKKLAALALYEEVTGDAAA
jgi:hypothetical protein